MLKQFKQIARRLPFHWQRILKVIWFGRQIDRRRFRAPEPEFDLLPQWVKNGDWVIDVGANIGHYTVALSKLVGATGRVFAVEPASETFEVLAANVARTGMRNVTLINAAASDRAGTAQMTLPSFASGEDNYYQAAITQGAGDFEVATLALDSLGIERPVAFVKMDVEGHEASALRGMRAILERDHPTLVVEGASPEVVAFLTDLGYRRSSNPGSPNAVYVADRSTILRSAGS